VCRYTREEIDKEVRGKRKKMLGGLEKLSDEQKLDQLRDKDDTHAIAKRKEAEMSKMAQAFGLQNAVCFIFAACISCEMNSVIHLD
jgi:hypothetical protein